MARFQKGCPGGPGRPKGSVKAMVAAELSAAASESLGRHFKRKVRRLLGSSDQWVVLSTLKWLADRAHGKVPQTIKASGLDPNSPEGILLGLAGFAVLPGASWSSNEPQPLPAAPVEVQAISAPAEAAVIQPESARVDSEET